MLISPSAMIGVIASNFILLFCSSDVSGLDSSIGVTENMVAFDSGELVAISLLFVILIGSLTWLLRALKHGTKKRRSFGSQTKKLVMRNQKFKCLICRMNVGIWDYDHKDGNRGNNKVSNCQVLCPTCHAKKSRGLVKCETQNKNKNIGVGVVVGIILIMILYSYGI
jgi:hypothetical protein